MNQVPPWPKAKEFWLDARNETYHPKGKKCDHYFQHLSAKEIECRNCHAGFIYSLGMEVKNGHIYIHGSFVI